MRLPGRGTRSRIVAAIVSIGCLAPLTYRIFQPFLTTADKDAAMYALVARNYVRYGPIRTRLGMTLNVGEDPGRLSIYDHHPPGVPLAAAAVYAVAGVSDWGSRIYPGLCALGTAVCLFFLWRRYRGSGPALLAVVVLATLPAYAHFGRKLGEESPTCFWALLACLLYLMWKSHARAGWTRLIPCLASLALACLSGWAGFYLGPLLMTDALVTLGDNPAKRRVALAGASIVTAGTFALVLGHIAWTTGSLGNVLEAALGRLSARDAAASQTVIVGWILREAGYFVRLFGGTASGLAAAGVAAGLMALLRGRCRAPGIMTVMVLTGFGLAHVLVFRGAAYNHDWMLYPLLPCVAIGAAEGLLLLASILAAASRRIAPRGRGADGIRGATVIVACGALVIGGARGAHHLSTEARRYAWPMLAQRIAALAPPDAFLVSNIRIGSFPLRFYLDRSIASVASLSELHDRSAGRDRVLFLEHVNTPLPPDLARFLAAGDAVALAGFRIHDIVPNGSGPLPRQEEEREGRGVRSGRVDVEFGGEVRLAGYRIEGPRGLPAPVSGWRTFLGLREGTMSPDRLVRVATDWTTDRDALRDWRVSHSMVSRTEGTFLPQVSLDEVATPSLSAWSGRRQFRIPVEFLFAEDSAAGVYELQVVLNDGRDTVRPVLPGQPDPTIKVVRIGPIPLPGE